MIVKEEYKPLPDGRERVRYFSDKGLEIRKVGTDEVYDEAIELAETVVQYEETNEKEEAADV